LIELNCIGFGFGFEMGKCNKTGANNRRKMDGE
jgi:hypothetical protein